MLIIVGTGTPPFALSGFGWRRVSPEAPKERRETAPLWCVYFLEQTNGDIDVESTNDLRRRIKSHDDGHVLSAKLHLPVKLKSYVAVETESVARAGTPDFLSF